MMEKSEEGAPDRSPGVSNRLEVALEPDPQGVRVRIAGELDLATAPELDQLLDEVGNGGYERVLIDLSGLEFMDSTGLSSIVRAYRLADTNGHRLTLRRGSPQVQRLFEITETLDRFAFED